MSILAAIGIGIAGVGIVASLLDVMLLKTKKDWLCKTGLVTQFVGMCVVVVS
jgi:hypothetical protein